MNLKPKRYTFIILFTLFAVMGWGTEKGFAQSYTWSGTSSGIEVSANSTVTITLNGNTTLTGYIIVWGGATVTLDLNGCRLDRQHTQRVAVIRNGGKLIIKDSRPTSTSHAGSLHSVTLGGYTYTNIWYPDNSGSTKVTLNGGIITGGRNPTDGGGCIQVDETSTLEIQGGTIAGNIGNGHGGAIGMYDQSKFIMSGGSICYNGGHSGGGVMAHNGTTSFTMTGGSINYNVAKGHGGGVYCASTTISIQKGNFLGNEAANIGGSTGDGGAIAIESGHSAVIGTTTGALNIKNNKANIGAGICAEGSASLTLYGNVTIDNNTATFQGGGVVGGDNSSNPTHKIDIYGVTITNNKVTNSSGAGGGLHNGYAQVRFIGTDNINIYGNTVGTTASDIYLLPADNVTYTPRDKIEVTRSDIKPVRVGIYRRVGDANNEPFFYSSSGSSVLSTVYTNITNGTYNVYSNKVKYSYCKIKYNTSTDAKNIYFTNPWSTTQQGISTSTESLVNGVYQIGTVQQLTAFLCRVNGITTNNTASFGTGNLSAKGILTADINMSGHFWIPIGNSAGYTGTFDGNGYCIYNLTLPSDNPSAERGMFGLLQTGCEVKNLQLHSCNYSYSIPSGTWMGCIASRILGGTIHDCVVDGTLAGNSTATFIGGLVGSAGNVTIHSCSAMATVSGGTRMGGLVGSLSGGTVKNCFANPTITTGATSGGLVGYSTGTVYNCYMRIADKFVGTSNPGTVQYCYGPSGTTTTGTGQSNCGWFYAPVAPYKYTRTNDNTVGPSALVNLLNQRRGTGEAEWKRTTAGGYSSGAGNINGDYPIHKYSQYTCVASTNGKVLDYAKTLDIMLTRHTSNTTVNLYTSGSTSKGTGSGVVVYIDENISLLQTTTNAITAYTCQTLPGNPRSWHFVSSSLSDSGIGFTYGQNAAFNWDPNPCHVTISTNDDASLFPSDLPKVGGYSDMSRIDLYCFYEPEYHWINLKRNSASHWHMNATTVPITYTNETTLTPGKGYLVSADKDLLLQNKGTLNNGDVTVTLGYSPAQAWAGLLGYNLIGNPYQSYLDFSKFAAQNSSLWYDNSKGKAVEPTYAVYDEAMGGYIQYKEGASRGSKSAPGILNMHQGFMVRSSGATRAKFTNAMRTNDGTSTGIREEQPAFPLINFTVTDDEGVNDFAVLELGRDADAGAEKLRANDCKGWLYLRHNDEDYGILFRSEVDDYQPLWFETDEEGIYTLSWETVNAEFESLTLIDNITGVTTDMLATDSYTFEANPDQYASRFKVVIGDWKDVEENEGGASTGSATFAYYANGEIHLVETCQGASLQIIDMTGRVILCKDASNASAISTNGIAPGIYLLRLTTSKGTKTQKMVIE